MVTAGIGGLIGSGKMLRCNNADRQTIIGFTKN